MSTENQGSHEILLVQIRKAIFLKIFSNNEPSLQEGRGLIARPRRQMDWMKGYWAALGFWTNSASGSLYVNSETLEDV
jgi:hypothetical protein